MWILAYSGAVGNYDGQKLLLIICAHAMFSLPRNSDRALFLLEITRSNPQIILKAHNKFIFLHPPGKQMDRHEDGIHPRAPRASSHCMLYLGGQWGGLVMGVARDGPA